MIENPEAHLHPQGQSQMGELLAKTAADGVQILVETHSDHLINGIRRTVKKGGSLSSDSTAFHFFSRGEPGTGSVFETPTLSADGRFNKWPSGFFDEWDKAVLELI
jgi:predicted ATPase